MEITSVKIDENTMEITEVPEAPAPVVTTVTYEEAQAKITALNEEKAAAQAEYDRCFAIWDTNPNMDGGRQRAIIARCDSELVKLNDALAITAIKPKPAPIEAPVEEPIITP